jgi:hypothetical protein
MDTPLSAAATTAGTLVSSGRFVIPPFQREYAWREDEVKDFWADLREALAGEHYFLGLVILTDEDDMKHVVDGQQRLLTLSILAAALFHEAVRAGRRALADRLSADFLFAIDYETEETQPRVILSDTRDNATFQRILKSAEEVEARTASGEDDLSPRLAAASRLIRQKLRADLGSDAFKRLGQWTDFLTNKVYFAAFVHPDPASAYRVFEVVNTRGRGLTTADLLKNFVLSQVPSSKRETLHEVWTRMAHTFEGTAPGAFVQFIRHVTTISAGYILPRDLFDYLSGREVSDRSRPRPLPPAEFVSVLDEWAPLYLQMIDPTIAGPADEEWLSVFNSLNELGVISVRPVLMAMSLSSNPTSGMREVLRLVVRRIVVGNLGTGSVERRFGDAAKAAADSRDWSRAMNELNELNPPAEDFVEQLRKRSFNKGTLAFMRRSTLQTSLTPVDDGYLHLVRPRQAPEWVSFPDDEFTYWGSTLGNTFLAKESRRPRLTATWAGFRENLLPLAATAETPDLFRRSEWSASDVEAVGFALARQAASVWY